MGRGGSRDSLVRAPNGKHRESGAWCVAHGAAKGWQSLPRAQRRSLSQSMYSKTFTTFFTPPVVLAISAASCPSLCVTRPIKYTTLSSVTTLT